MAIRDIITQGIGPGATVPYFVTMGLTPNLATNILALPAPFLVLYGNHKQTTTYGEWDQDVTYGASRQTVTYDYD